MLRSAVASLLEKYQWFINPHAGRRDRIVLLLENFGFMRARYSLRKYYNVYYDAGRLIGIFYSNVPGELFNTQVRVCIYHKRDFGGEDLGKEKYLLVYMFTHQEGADNYRMGSSYKTEWSEFADLVKYLKTSSAMADARARIFSIQEYSKVSPVARSLKSEKT